MFTTRTTIIITGAFFLVATASYIVGKALIDAVGTTPAQQANLNNAQLRLGVLFQCIDAAAVVAIGILLFPIVSASSEGIAVGYLGTRIVECVMLLVSEAGALLLVPLAQAYAQTSSGDAAQLQTLSRLILEWHDQAFQLAMIALGAGSLTLCYVLYEFRLVPRALSILGFVGYVALFASGWLDLFGRDSGSLLFIPGAIFEVIFPVWLIAKGIGKPGVTARLAPT